LALETIIIRADGALAETEDLRREAFAQVFADAGFQWNYDRASFAKSQKVGTARARMAHFVRLALKGKPETQDLSPLIDAMHRRAGKLFSELIDTTSIEPRPAVRKLVTAARQEGLRLAVTTLLEPKDAETLLLKTLGSWAPKAFTICTTPGRSDGDASAANKELYCTAIESMGLQAHDCLVIEATASGAIAAREIGLPVVLSRSAFCSERTDSASNVVFEDLPTLLGVNEKQRSDPLTVDERTQLIETLQRLHTGISEGHSGSQRSDVMRVADILKIKGPEVKTIEPSATIRAFADGLNAERVGAMVVLSKGGAVEGIISERDLVRGLAEFGSDLPSIKVSQLMTRAVVTCAPEDGVAAVAKVMTQRRIRHLPVVVNGALVGLVSIGDVLKHRLDEVQLEANVLRDFAIARR
jgi:CBS domain-containing protein/beta-phosphoglucomutase-like phosphatase (HAD superfamily)